MSAAHELLNDIFAENSRLCKMHIGQFREYLADPDTRISYTFKRLEYCLESNVYFPTRAFTGAAKIIGSIGYTPTFELKRAFHGGDFAILKEKMARAVPERSVGYVYFAAGCDLTQQIKIGFSKNVPRRLSALGLRLLGKYPGTLLDEHVFHCANASTRKTRGEWFLSPPFVPPEINERINLQIEHDKKIRALAADHRFARQAEIAST